MLNYREFLTESKLEILLESELKLSKSFQNILKGINSNLSKKIMDLSNQDIDTLYNFIDISQSENDSVTFILDKKAKEIIGEKEYLYKVINSGKYLTNSVRNKTIYNRLNHEILETIYVPEVGAIGKIISETYGSGTKIYCLFECVEGVDSGKRTILNKEALEEYDPSFKKVWTANRNPIKIGRLLRALLRSGKISATDKEVEEFVNSYKSSIDILNDAFLKFDIVEGEKISELYSYVNYNSMEGTLGNSCMADVSDYYFYMYVKNPDVCKLVVLYDDNGVVSKSGENIKYTSSKIKGRALLWTTRVGGIFMDRIYTNNDSDVDLFKKFADKNGWWHKKSQNSDNEFYVQRGTEIKEPIYIVDLQKWNDNYPYLDSLQYINSGTGELSNSYYSIDSGDFSIRTLTNTNGNYDEYEE
jgi:hypothetical protein